jgi:UDP-N-acetylglucosamine diphosphorylase / glucose-1-phosphate thymidylyltransferase / UDP-N-acetylgalactosamine diphosphorylase / glucosamine-1-phosphate N-acetyltransferase / galactosamine-1-phosphate N-acetyltransferase
MKTLLLAAGRSKRFWPLAEKSLFPVAGTSLLQLQIKRLKEAGLHDITIVCGKHNKKEITTLFPKTPVIEQKDLTLGMQGALLSALPRFKHDPVLVVSGNDVIDVAAYKDLLVSAGRNGVGGAILARKVSSYFPGGYLMVKGGRITGVMEKPGAGKEPSKLVNIVAHVHNDAALLLKALRGTNNHRDDGYERALALLFADHVYHAVPYTGAWQAVKYPWHLLSLLTQILGEIKEPSIAASAKIHKTAVIEGNVIIEKDARILPHATVVGPSYIGAGAIIGTGALVRGSSIGEKCVIGFSSEIKGSILATSVWTHMTYLGDSVIGENVSFGGGMVTGNFRLDEGEISSGINGESIPTGMTKVGTIIGNDCRIGIQVGTNPGIKIGMGSFIAGGTYVTEDIPDASFVKTQEGRLIVRPNKISTPSVEKRVKYLKN